MEPYISEIRMFGFSYAPRGWAFANGQLLSIKQNRALYELLGTTFGGDGVNTFGLPNLQGAAPVHMGNGIYEGQVLGEATHTLKLAEMPSHTHVLSASATTADGPLPGNTVLGGATNAYAPADNNVTPMSPGALATVGQSQPHNNMQPYLTLNFCIALQGVFPSQG